MELILLKDVDRLGSAGERVKVKDGYARNFLIPRGLAVQATPSRAAQAEEQARGRRRADEARRAEAEALARRIEEVPCTVPVAVGAQGKLHGSVGAARIAGLLAERGLRVERHQILLERPLTRVGEARVPVRLHPQVSAELRVVLVEQGRDAESDR